MTILITGADGFIGKHLSQALNIEGIKNIPLTLEIIDLTNLNDLIHFCEQKEIKPSLIVHCATAVRNENLEYNDNSLAVNTRMFNNIMYLAKKHKSYLINLGSGSDVNRQYWCANMDEHEFLNHPPSLEEKHGTSKNIISTIIHNSDYEKVLNLRLFGVFGVGEDYSAKLIPNTIAKCILGLPIRLIADRHYDYINVEDLGRFIIEIAKKVSKVTRHTEKKIWNDTDINFCSGSLTSIHNIASYISANLNPNVSIILESKQLGKDYGGAVKRLNANFPKFQFTDVYEGIDAMIKYYTQLKDVFSHEVLTRDTYLSHAKKINV